MNGMGPLLSLLSPLVGQDVYDAAEALEDLGGTEMKRQWVRYVTKDQKDEEKQKEGRAEQQGPIRVTRKQCGMTF